MMFKSHYGETVTVVLAIVMGFVMAFAIIVIDHLELHFSHVFQIWAMVTLVILLVSAVIPYKAWSARFTGLFHLPEGSIAYRVVDNILPSLILNTFNTVIVSATSVFLMRQFLRPSRWAFGCMELYTLGQLPLWFLI